MGLKYLWDTNIIIYYLQEKFLPPAEEQIDGIVDNYTTAFSIISEIEISCWKFSTEGDINLIKGFILNSVVFELTTDIKLKTIEIRKTYSLKLPDAIIAATAIVMDLTLITNDNRGFSKVPSLKILNPAVAKQ